MFVAWGRVARAAAAVGFVVALTACTSSDPTPAASLPGDRFPGPDPASCAVQPSPAPVEPAWQAYWAGLGITPPPPQQITPSAGTALPPVRNQTNGAVSDASVETAAVALQKSLDLVKWAEQRLNVAFFRSGPVANNASAYTQVADGYNRLRAEGVVFRCFDGNTTLTSVEMVVPAGKLAKPGDLVFVIHETLGTKDLFIYADGHNAPVYGTRYGDSPQPRLRLIAGHLLVQPVLGPVWYLDSDGLCTVAADPNDLCTGYGVKSGG